MNEPSPCLIYTITGGQSFVIKLRPTDDRSVSSKLLEPPYSLNGTHVDYRALTPRWRHMKYVRPDEKKSLLNLQKNYFFQACLWYAFIVAFL